MIQLQALKQIAVISDTHGLLRESVLAQLQEAEAILHAGDVGKPKVLEQLAAIAPCWAVKGNVDHGAWASDLPFDLHVSLNGKKCYMVHRREDISEAVWQTSPALVIFGHSHKPHVGKQGDTVLVNPGSIGPRRFQLPISMVMLHWEGENWRPVFVELPG